MKNTFKESPENFLVYGFCIVTSIALLAMIVIGIAEKNLVIQAEDIVPAVTETSYSVRATEAAELLYDYYN